MIAGLLLGENEYMLKSVVFFRYCLKLFVSLLYKLMRTTQLLFQKHFCKLLCINKCHKCNCYSGPNKYKHRNDVGGAFFFP